jgi:hypothetical protein
MELGALSLRIQTEGDAQVLSSLNRIDAQAKKTSASTIQGATASAAANKALSRSISESTAIFSLQGRTADVTNKQMVAALRQNAAAQLQWMQTVGASEKQLLQFAAAVQTFEKRVDAASKATVAMSPKVRQGAGALTALAIAASTGDGSIRGIATSAGIAASVMAETFGPAKWAAYASGIGAAVLVLTALVGIMERMSRAKPISDAVKLRLENTQTIEDATAKLDQLRRKADEAAKAFEELSGVRALLSPPDERFGGATGILRQLRAKNEMEQAQKEVEDFFRGTVIPMRRQQERAAQDARLDEIARGAQRELALYTAKFATEAAREQAAFAAGERSLSKHFDVGQSIIEAGVEKEQQALETELRAVRAEARPTDTEADRLTRLSRIRDLESQIQQVAARGQQSVIELTAQRAAAERQLADQVRQYNAQALTAAGRTLEARLQQIDAEAEARRRLPLQADETAEQREASIAAVTAALKTQARLQQAQTDLSRLQTDLDTRRQGVQNRLAANKINEREAAEEIRDIERSALPTLQQMVTLALQFAAALGDEGAVASLRQLEAQFEGLGTLLTPLQQRMKEILSGIDQSLGATVIAAGDRIRQMIAEAGGKITVQVVIDAEALLASAQQVDEVFKRFGAGFGATLVDSIAAAASGGSGKDVLLAGLGGIFQEMGKALLIHGLTMSKLLPALLNPFTSGPAAIAAGVALTALGAALGAAAKGGRVSAGGTQTVGGGTPISISRLIVDPNAGVRDRVGRSMSTGMAAAVGAQPQIIKVIGINTPEGQSLIGTSNARYNARGGR